MNRAVWEILNEMRSGQGEWDTDQLVDRLSKREPKPSAADLWLLCSQLQEKKTSEAASDPSDPFGILQQRLGQGSVFGAFFGGHALQQPMPDIVTDFALDYIASANPKRLLNPWTEEPVAVSALLNRLPSLSKALAFTRTSQTVWQAELFNQMTNRILGWNKAAEWRVGKSQESRFGRLAHLVETRLARSKKSARNGMQSFVSRRWEAELETGCW